MRVIAGRFRGFPLKGRKHPDIKPTQDNIKEALFNILSPSITKETCFLDLFAGFGGNGIEALSRGAGKVVFIEKLPLAVKEISGNLREIEKKFTASSENKERLPARIIKDDVLRGLRRLVGEGQLFDMIFLDPPYFTDLPFSTLSEILRFAKAGKLLKSSFMIVCEGDYAIHEEMLLQLREHYPEEDNGYAFSHRRYGSHGLLFIQKED